MARFLLKQGNRHMVLLPGECYLGRSSTCHVQVEDQLVSRRHARVRVYPDRVYLEDLGSQNGVYVNGRRVLSEVELRDGDRLTLGTQELLFSEEQPRKHPAAEPPTGRLEDADRIAAEHAAEQAGEGDTRVASLDLLSRREQEVLRLIAHGYAQREVGEMLGVSVKTIETYRARLNEKLGLQTRAELVRFALNAGLLQGEN